MWITFLLFGLPVLSLASYCSTCNSMIPVINGSFVNTNINMPAPVYLIDSQGIPIIIFGNWSGTNVVNLYVARCGDSICSTYQLQKFPTIASLGALGG
jgi:hypothetical protein